MATPGYYKINHRALGLGGAMKIRGWWRGLLGWWFLRRRPPSPVGWLPGLWADSEARREEMAGEFWEATKQQLADFASLGFEEINFKKFRRNLNPSVLESGGVNYLDASRSQYAQLLYNRIHLPEPINRDRITVSVSFTAVYPQQVITHTNNRNPFGILPGHKIVRHGQPNVRAIHSAFLNNLARMAGTPRRFEEVTALREWFDASQIEMHEDRVRRGIFVRMSDGEVEEAKRRLPPPLPGGASQACN